MKVILFAVLLLSTAFAINFKQIDIARPNAGNTIGLPITVDYNKDGLNDIIVHTATSSGGQVHSLINNGNYNFVTNLLFSYTTPYANQLAVGDLDNDGDIDFVKFVYSADYTTAKVVAHINNNGVFTLIELTASIPSVTSLVIVDINSDGKSDIVVSAQPGIWGLYNQGGNSFTAAGSFAHIVSGTDDCHQPGFVAGKLPFLPYPNVVFAACWSGNTKYIYFDGTTLKQLVIGGNYNSYSLGLADFTGDSIPDIVSAGMSCWNVNWYAGKTSGAWTQGNLPGGLGNGCYSRSFVSAGDYDGDGWGDIAVAVDYVIYVISNVKSASGTQTLGSFSGSSIAYSYPIYRSAALYNNAIGNSDLLLNNGAGTLSIFTSCFNCSSCPANSYVDANGVCTACPASYGSKAGSKSCYRVCSAGTYGTYPSCSECPSGAYSADGATSCINCPLNQVSTGSSCQSCPANTYPSNGQCAPCSLGYYSNAGSVSCGSCASGTVRGSCDTTCKTCPAGTYASTHSCVPCPAGTYSGTTGALSCTTCVAGAISSSGAASCSACPSGQTSNSARTLCYLP